MQLHLCYISSVENSVMLQLFVRQDFHNVVFKMKHKNCT